MRKFVARNWVRLCGAVAGCAVLPSLAMADGGLTMPALPTTDIYTAAGVVLAFIAVPVGIFVVIKMIRKAG